MRYGENTTLGLTGAAKYLNIYLRYIQGISSETIENISYLGIGVEKK